jgi:hypothetical protein
MFYCLVEVCPFCVQLKAAAFAKRSVATPAHRNLLRKAQADDAMTVIAL